MKRFEEVTINRLGAYSWIVLGHIAFMYLLFTFQWQLLLISLLMHYLIAIPGISMTYHRSISHNAIKLPKYIEFI